MDSSKSPASDPLAGFTIGVTAARRSEEFITLLERRGATVLHAPAIRIIPLVDDVELRRVTTLLIEQPPDVVVVTTGIGFRGWIEAAHGWDVADDLIAALASTRILARGPKARGAVRQAGLCEEWSPESEASPEVLERLLAEGAAGLRIAVQLHGAASEWEPNADICDALTLAGAQVIQGARVPLGAAGGPPADGSADRDDRPRRSGRGELHQRPRRRVNVAARQGARLRRLNSSPRCASRWRRSAWGRSRRRRCDGSVSRPPTPTATGWVRWPG